MPDTPATSPPAVLIAKGEGFEFFQKGDNVFKVKEGWIADVTGDPGGMRWECSIEAWGKFREAVYPWAEPQN